jgi:hypothetical protein
MSLGGDLIKLAWVKKYAIMIHLFIGRAPTRVPPGQRNHSGRRIDRDRRKHDRRCRLTRGYVDRIAPGQPLVIAPA